MRASSSTPSRALRYRFLVDAPAYAKAPARFWTFETRVTARFWTIERR
jgi:hypothetical protein